MNKNVNSLIFSHVRSNKIKYIFILVLLFTGIFSGAISASYTYINYKGQNILSSVTSDELYNNGKSVLLFLNIFLINIRTFFIIWLSGRVIWLIPLNFFEMLSKGFGFGYTISYLFLSGGWKGVSIVFRTMMVQSIVLIPLLVIFSVIQFNLVIERYKIHKSSSAYKQKKSLGKKELWIVSSVVFIVILCSLLESCIVPTINILIT